jgi:hypothetical protein
MRKGPFARSRFRHQAAVALPAVAALLLLAAHGCERRQADERPGETGGAPAKTEPVPSAPAPASAGGTASPPAPPGRPDVPGPFRYGRVPVLGPGTLVALRDSLGEAGFFEILKINRLDLRHIRKGDSLIVALAPADSLRFSPFPLQADAASALPKLLLVSVRVQAFAAYESGRLKRWGPTSTGREETPTPPRLYHTNWKDKERVSTFNDEWQLTWYVNLDNFLGISLHQYELPGRPASHSCVRLLEEDARWLYGWSEQWKLTPDGVGVVEEGTPVVIFGEYAYGKRPQWKRLPEDPAAASIPTEEIEGALRRYLVAAPAPVATTGAQTADSVGSVPDR